MSTQGIRYQQYLILRSYSTPYPWTLTGPRWQLVAKLELDGFPVLGSRNWLSQSSIATTNRRCINCALSDDMDNDTKLKIEISIHYLAPTFV